MRMTTRLDAPAGIGRDDADGGADEAGDEDRAAPTPERDAQAVEDGREHVAALLVRAEQIGEPAVRVRSPGGSMLSMMSSWARS